MDASRANSRTSGRAYVSEALFISSGKRRIGQKAGDSSMGGIGDPVAASG